MRRTDEDIPLAEVQYTANFALNLDGIASVWIETGFGESFDCLLSALSDAVVPNLAKHSGIGRPFGERIVDSVEAERIAERIAEHIASRLSALVQDVQVREYVMDKDLVLYACFRDARNRSSIAQLLSITHQKQLSFDFQPEM
jgi:hypothetical protein